jgi:hypothetical protein
MHGGSFQRDLASRFYQRLQHEPFAFNGTLMGRQIGNRSLGQSHWNSQSGNASK